MLESEVEVKSTHCWTMKQFFHCKIQHLNHISYRTPGKCLPSEDGWNEVHGKSPSKHVHHRGRGLLQPLLRWATVVYRKEPSTNRHWARMKSGTSLRTKRTSRKVFLR